MTEPPRGPVNVRVVHDQSGMTAPIDTIYVGTNKEGLDVWEVVQLPEWFEPGTCRLTADELPPKGVLSFTPPPSFLEKITPARILQLQAQIETLRKVNRARAVIMLAACIATAAGILGPGEWLPIYFIIALFIWAGGLIVTTHWFINWLSERMK